MHPLNTFSNKEWLSNIDPLKPTCAFRKTSIICTLGPATDTPEAITSLRKAGMNIARLNFSHGTHQYHTKLINAVRKSEEEWKGRPVAIALDMKGPEKRLGDLENSEGYEVKIGTEVILTTDPKCRNCGNPFTCGVFIDFSAIGQAVKIGQSIFVDDGSLKLTVLKIVQMDDYCKVYCKAENAQRILGRKGVNLPDYPMTQPPISEKDKGDLEFAVRNKLDFILVSFTRDAADIQAVRNTLHAFDPKNQIKVIAKIENKQGLANFSEILKQADGILVERGDLGIEIPLEKVALAQKMMIARCNIAGKPVICATQMLESMTCSARPTRAEVTDVTNAVLDGADCVMLSGESAVGQYPSETVTMMHRICLEAESIIPPYNEDSNPIQDEDQSEQRAALDIKSFNGKHSAIVILAKTLESVRFISNYRPRAPIIAIATDAQIARQLNLYRGCIPLFVDSQSITNDLKAIDYGIQEAKKIGLLSRGNDVVCWLNSAITIRYVE